MWDTEEKVPGRRGDRRRDRICGLGFRVGSGESMTPLPACARCVPVHFPGQREQNFHQLLRKDSISKDQESLLEGLSPSAFPGLPALSQPVARVHSAPGAGARGSCAPPSPTHALAVRTLSSSWQSLVLQGGAQSSPRGQDEAGFPHLWGPLSRSKPLPALNLPVAPSSKLFLPLPLQT